MGISSKKENKVDAISDDEQKLFKILSQTNRQTLIGISIRERLQRGSLGGFREMIKELYDQSLVARNELIRAIGEEGVELIESISCS
jgi:hypothetical protein